MTYNPGSSQFERLTRELGEGKDSLGYFSYSLMSLNESEINAYNEHSMIKEAFEHTGSFEGAILEDMQSGFIKTRRRMETHTWQIFRKSYISEDTPFDLWMGYCIETGNGLKCSFFYIYDNYLLHVDLSESLLLKRPLVKKEVELDIKNNLFCKS